MAEINYDKLAKVITKLFLESYYGPETIKLFNIDHIAEQSKESIIEQIESHKYHIRKRDQLKIIEFGESSVIELFGIITDSLIPKIYLSIPKIEENRKNQYVNHHVNEYCSRIAQLDIDFDSI